MAIEKKLKLTQLSSCAGCAAKLNRTLLAEILQRLGPSAASANGDRRVIVGADTFDDAGVYRLTAETALVQTVDFFTPIVDDPADYGKIAATNALSDVFAMGGRPLTALNLLGVPADRVGPEAIAAILRGGASKVKEAGCSLIGGHTIRSLEPIYGLSVTGIVHPQRIMTNSKARPGDLLLLTKPIGTGIATTAIKRGLASNALAQRVTRIMKQINFAGADLAEKVLVKAATDVTGFGLMGHLENILQASHVGAQLVASDVPAISNEIASLIAQDCVPGGTQANLAAADRIADWPDVPPEVRIFLCDAQTSGGLLLCVPPKNLASVQRVLKKNRTAVAAVIGCIVRSPAGRIVVKP